MFEDLGYHIILLDESNNLHLAITFGAEQGIARIPTRVSRGKKGRSDGAYRRTVRDTRVRSLCSVCVQSRFADPHSPDYPKSLS